MLGNIRRNHEHVALVNVPPVWVSLLRNTPYVCNVVSERQYLYAISNLLNVHIKELKLTNLPAWMQLLIQLVVICTKLPASVSATWRDRTSQTIRLRALLSYLIMSCVVESVIVSTVRSSSSLRSGVVSTVRSSPTLRSGILSTAVDTVDAVEIPLDLCWYIAPSVT